MSVEFPIKAVISAVDKITGPIRKISATISANFGGALRGLAGLSNRATKAIAGFVANAAMIGGAAIVGGVVALGKSYLDTTGELFDFARQTGFAVEALQEFEYAAKITGIESADLRSAIESLNKGMGQARAGSGKLAKFLGKVSPALLAQVKAAKSTDQAFELIVAALEKIPDPARRAALATAAFGGAGQKIVRFADDGVAGLDALRAEARALGIVMSTDQVSAAADAGDSLDKLTFAIKGVANSLISTLIPVLQPMIDKLVEWFKANRDLIRSKITEWIDGLVASIKGVDWSAVIAGAKEFWQVLKDTWTAIGGLKGAILIYAGVLTVELVAATANAVLSIGKLGAAVAALNWSQWLSSLQYFAFAAKYHLVTTLVPALLGGFKAIGAGFRALTLAIATNPIGAAIALLVTAIALVIYNWQDFEEFGDELWRTLKQAWADGARYLNKAWEWLTKTGRELWSSLAKFFDDLWRGIKSVFASAWEYIGGIVDKVSGAVSKVVGGARKLAAAVGIGSAPEPAGAPASAAPASIAGPMPAPLAARAGAAFGAFAPQAVAGEIKVSFDNAPAGLKVTSATASGGVDVSASVGRRAMVTQ